MTYNLKKLSAFTFVLATMVATHVYAAPEVTNKTDLKLNCKISAFYVDPATEKGDYKICGKLITIATGAKHDFATGGNAAFNQANCAASPKPAHITDGYNPWRLNCSDDEGSHLAEAHLGIAGDLAAGSLDVATPKTVTLSHGELIIN